MEQDGARAVGLAGAPPAHGPSTIGRYALHREIGSGGMATVYLGRLLGIGGFSRTVAIKRLRRELAKDPTFVAMLLDEARLASRIRHPNVVSTLDVGFEQGELFVVLDYVHGEPLSRLIPASSPGGVPPDVAVAVLAGVLRGLHAAHEARGKDGSHLELVHRDVSPQNVIVGADGLARVLDFGVAKATGRLHKTQGGELKGKVAYMSKEQLLGQPLDRRADVYAATVVLWETLTGKRLFPDKLRLGGSAVTIAPPSAVVEGIPSDLDAIVACGTSDDREERFSTAEAMAVALENAVKPASPEKVAAWVERVAGPRLRERAELVSEVEGADSIGTLPAAPVGAPIAPEPERMPSSPSVPDVGPTTQAMSVVPSEPAPRTLLSATIADSSRPRPPVAIEVIDETARVEEPPGSNTSLVLVALVAAAIGAAGVVAFWRSSQGTASPNATTTASATSSATMVTTAPPTPVATDAPDAPSPPPPASTPAPSHRPTAHPPIHKPPPAALPPRPSCDPPYRVGDDGVRHPKPECF